LSVMVSVLALWSGTGCLPACTN